MKPDGTPNFAKVLGGEPKILPRIRYGQTKSQYGVGAITLFWYIECQGAKLKAGVPYIMVYRNVADLNGLSPTGNFFSHNSIGVNAAAAGPHDRNTLDANAPGAILGLDPREALCWTDNGGTLWEWGSRVGHYKGSGDYGTRMPHYALLAKGDSRPRLSGQPFTAYAVKGNFKLRYKASTAGSYAKAGGYAPSGSNIGVVTVRNERTGASASTPSLPSGYAKGNLSAPVPRLAGDPILITHSGTVMKAEWDGYQQEIMGDSGFATEGNGGDRAQVFAE